MNRVSRVADRRRRLPRRPAARLLLCGAAAGPVFVTTFAVAGAVRPAYRPMRYPVSSLALGPGRWVQILNFVVSGTLYIAGAVGLARAAPGSRVVPVLVGATGAGLVGAGAFATDPIGGYPPGTPEVPTTRTAVGVLHDLSSVPVFFGLPAAAVVHARQQGRAGRTGWAVCSATTAVAMLVNFVLASAGFMQQPSFVERGGLHQRISIIAGFSWLTALCLSAARRR